MITEQEAREAVAKGAAVLDEKVPGWRIYVNPDRVDISSSEFCVLGQLGHRHPALRYRLDPDDRSGMYGQAVDHLGLRERAGELGFNHFQSGMTPWEAGNGQDHLTRAWRELLAAP